MESGRRKRQMEINEEQKVDDEDDEEEKVEKFFALIRSTKEIRDRLRTKEEEHKAGQWNPSFRPEDFMEDSVSKSKIKNDAGPSSKTHHEPKIKNDPLPVSNDAGPSSKTQHGPEKEAKNEDVGEDGGANKLDLNLSLSL